MSLYEGQVHFIILGMPFGFGILISVVAGSPLLELTFKLTGAIAIVTSPTASVSTCFAAFL